jgi:hypothetical protein
MKVLPVTAMLISSQGTVFNYCATKEGNSVTPCLYLVASFEFLMVFVVCFIGNCQPHP